jgi:GT2 family glycosyltransferase
MLSVSEVFLYIKRRFDRRPVYLSTRVDRREDHQKQESIPSVTVVIPTRDKADLLNACVESVLGKTSYPNFKVVVVNNQSIEQSTLAYLEELKPRGITVLDFPKPFNFSEIANFASANDASDFLCFLNNDTEVLEPNWLSHLVDHALTPEVGLVGSKLLYGNGAVQHFGIALGFTGAAGHPYSGIQPKDLPEGLDESCFEVSGVTFACALVSKEDYVSLGGLDAKFRVGLNDVDFALRMIGIGKRTVVCGRSCLTHHESRTRRSMTSLPGAAQAIVEVMEFTKRHGAQIRADNYFSR